MRRMLSVLVVVGACPVAGAEVFQERGRFLLDPAVEPRDPVAIAVGDFNGDSIPDVGAALRYKDLSIFVQDPGRAAWTRRDVLTPDHDYDYGKAHAAEVNGDGVDDLVCFIPPGAPRVLFGSTTGDFVQAPATMLPDPPWDLSLAELTGDGVPDLLAVRPQVSGVSRAVRIFPGRTDGTYGDPIEVPVTNPAALTCEHVLAAAGRLDLDGDSDIVLAFVGEERTTLSLLLQDAGSFSEAWTADVELRAEALRVVDLDGDGELDLAAVFQLDPMIFPEGTSTIVLYRALGLGALEEMTRWTTAGSIQEVGAADLDGDGRPEVVAGSALGRIATWRQTSPWTFALAREVLGGSGGFVLEDLDGDGLTDAVLGAGVGDSFPGPLLLRGRGDGTFSAAPVVREIYDSSYPALGDANGDGIPDLLYGIYHYSKTVGVECLLGDGAGRFSPPVASSFEVGSGMLETDFQVGDVDGDGRLDAVFATQDLSSKRRIVVFHGLGDGTFGAPALTDVPARLVTPRDLDGDGRAEVVALVGFYEGLQDKLPFVVVLRESATGVLEEVARYAQDLAPRSYAVADVDGDGEQDLMVYGSLDLAQGLVQPIALPGLGDGTFGPPRESDVQPYWGYGRIPLGDWNGDGKVDIVSPEGYAPGLGDGTFGPLQGPELYVSPLCPVLADLDLDGKDDVVLGLNNLHVILAPAGGAAPDSFIGGGTWAEFVMSADLDRDGDTDVVTSGRVVGVYLNGSVTSAARFVRGDSNADGTLDITDPILSLGFLFLGGPPPSCLAAADLSDDGGIDLSDAVQGLLYLFQGGPPPASPFPSCGVDPTSDALGCAGYLPCAQ